MNTSKRYGPRERMWAVIAAWMGGHLSEGQATKLLNISAVDLRERANEYKQVADEMWARYRKTGETIDDMHQFICDSCGRTFHEFEFVETIKEFLCERCASGIDPDEEFDDYGMEDGWEE